MSIADHLLRNNERYAESFDKGDLQLPPGKYGGSDAGLHGRTTNVYGMLGLEEGDAHAIRNAGGVITDDTIRSLMMPSACSAPARQPSFIAPTVECLPLPMRR